MNAGPAISLLAALLAATPAFAQVPAGDPGSDPISDILARPAPDPQEPDTAATGAVVEPDPVAPAAPPIVSRPPPALTRPVFVDEAGRTPDGPATPADLAYDSRLRASAASVRAFRGPLDGGWTVLSGARELYAFQLQDRDGGLQGAWRDLRRPGALDASGFVEQVERTETGVAFRLGGGARIALRADGASRWVGELDEAGRSQAVSLRRTPP